MREELEERFSDIAEDMLGKVASVECLRSEYREGLMQIISEIRSEIRASEASGDD